MSSEVEISNLALSNIRGGSINSLDEGSLQAQVCKLKYPILRDRLLAEIPWSFNRAIRPLSLLTIDVFNWAYAYQYPADCLKILRLMGENERLANGDADVISRLVDSQLLPVRGLRPSIEYEIFNFDDNKTIGSNDSKLNIDYASRITDPNLFSSDFVLALSHLLASEIAIPIVGIKEGRELRSDSISIYGEYLSAALANDLNEGYKIPDLSEFETIRR